MLKVCNFYNLILFVSVYLCMAELKKGGKCRAQRIIGIRTSRLGDYEQLI